jgi:hypothetical protein
VIWASVVLGGLLVIASPRHLPSIAQLVVATLAAAGGLFVSIHLLRPAIWMSPFNPGDRPKGSGEVRTEIDRIRARLSGRRTVVARGVCLPPEVIRLLQPLIAETAERVQCPPGRVPPTCRAILQFESPAAPAAARERRPNEAEAAAVVHRVLDELDALTDPPSSSQATVR